MSIVRHKQELQNYSVYDTTVTRGRSAQGETVVLGKPGLLQQENYTPPAEIQQKKYYIFGTNNITLNYNGTDIWRIPSGQIGFDKSQIIKFNVINYNTERQYTIFTKTGLLQLTLFSQRILVNKQNSSWYNWNDEKTKCFINHNLNGYIDFMVRYCCKQEVYLHNKVIDNNTLEIQIGDFFNKDLVQVLKSFKVTELAQMQLNKLINFDLYELSADSTIRIYSETDQDIIHQYSEISNNLKLQTEINYTDIEISKFTFQKDKIYVIYAITKEQFRNDYFELVIWKVDKSNQSTKQNVFSFYKYEASQCQWQHFDNDQEYDLQIPYRFTFLGYTKTHDLKMPKTDITGQDFLEGQQSFADTKTVSNQMSITKQFLYTLQDKKLKVLTPDLFVQDQANFILVYSSCWSQTYYCDMDINNISYQTWTTAKNMYNEDVNILTLKHNLNGIVKINVRNVRSDLYETYIIDQNTIQIVFMKHYKYNKTNFFVDLYTIWKVNS